MCVLCDLALWVSCSEQQPSELTILDLYCSLHQTNGAKKIEQDKSWDSIPALSGLDAGVEESVDVNDVLEEAPLGMGA